MDVDVEDQALRQGFMKIVANAQNEIPRTWWEVDELFQRLRVLQIDMIAVVNDERRNSTTVLRVASDAVSSRSLHDGLVIQTCHQFTAFVHGDHYNLLLSALHYRFAQQVSRTADSCNHQMNWARLRKYGTRLPRSAKTERLKSVMT